MGYEGLYEVSDYGQVRSLTRTFNPGGLRKLHHMKKIGYLRVQLRKENVPSNRLVHRLVAEAFIGPCPEGQEVLHIDGDHTNNWVGNLRYGTRRENIQDIIRMGRNHALNKTHCPRDHPLVEGNLVNRKDGKRSCLTCSREKAKIWQRNRRESLKLQ